MKVLKKIFSQLHIYIAWIILSSLVWSWIFMLATDTSASKKITLYVDANSVNGTEFSALLEEGMPQKLKMIKIYTSADTSFDSFTAQGADLFIVKGSDAEKYIDSFAKLDKKEGVEYYYHGGTAYGIKVYDKETKKGSATKFISYGDDDYYLFFGINSVHLGEINGSADDYSFVIADKIMKIY